MRPAVTDLKVLNSSHILTLLVFIYILVFAAAWGQSRDSGASGPEPRRCHQAQLHRRARAGRRARAERQGHAVLPQRHVALGVQPDLGFARPGSSGFFGVFGAAPKPGAAAGKVLVPHDRHLHRLVPGNRVLDRSTACRITRGLSASMPTGFRIRRWVSGCKILSSDSLSKRPPVSLFLWIPYLLLASSPRRWWIYTAILIGAVPVLDRARQADLDRSALQHVRADEEQRAGAVDPDARGSGGNRRKPRLRGRQECRHQGGQCLCDGLLANQAHCPVGYADHQARGARAPRS